MKKYWFIIETYVFLWKKESSVLVYNTLSGHGYTYNCTPLMSSFVFITIEQPKLIRNIRV